jgi:UDP-N-acetyl-D-mannosaminuronic acid dehydrogenase
MKRNGLNKIVIMGLGYIGLPTAAIFASHKKTVIGVDINPHVVNTVNQGDIHITEPGLNEMITTVVAQGYLKASLKPENADVFIITVPTPCDEDKKPDLSYIISAIEAIAPVLQKGNLIVLESTSPVGTTNKICQCLEALRPDLTFPHLNKKNPNIHVAYCPERIIPGKMLDELVHNNRIIGGMTKQCSALAKQMYSIFLHGNCFETETHTAEMVKLTENSFRDVNIAFANELSIICDQLGINVWELIQLANHHPRVDILQPSAGVGGHCIAVDPWFIVSSAPEHSPLIKTARDVNDSKPHYVATEILKQCQNKSKVKLTCLGLSFKADTDDLRESPALHIIENLSQYPHLELNIVEPHIDALPASLAELNNVKLISLDEACENTGSIVSLVKHKEFIDVKETIVENKEQVLDFVNLFSNIILSAPQTVDIKSTQEEIIYA